MNFPVINTINDVLPHIEGRDEFVVIDKGDYTYVDYRIVKEDTFPEEYSPRHECRGLIFCSKTGKILRRPFNKFFNLSERPDTQPHVVADKILESVVMEKLDGSMIAPYIVNGKVLWGTMAGHDTEVAQQFVDECWEPSMDSFARDMIGEGLTPIFEYCSPNNRIVVTYSKPKAVLTAIREIKTGRYYPQDELEAIALNYGLEHVKTLDLSCLEDILTKCTAMEDEEGYVIAHPSGFRIKVKCSWYVQLHKIKEMLNFEKDRVNFVLTGDLDDLAQFMPPEDYSEITDLKTMVHSGIDRTAKSYYARACEIWDRTGNRKDFAAIAKEDKCPSFLFRALDLEEPAFRRFVEQKVLDSCTGSTRLAEYKWIWKGQ